MKGFALIEVLISALIFSFIIAGIYGIMNIANVSFPIDLGLLDLQQQARQGMAWITKETRESSWANPGNIGTCAGNISFNTPNETGIQYYLNGNQVVREYPAGTTKVVAQNITCLKFSQSGKVLDIQITASKVVLLKPLSFSLREKVRLRNE